ncbi:MAG: HEAT repeat domain-containing protein [Burkholderiaceae bacterium]|nr:HEAT repeat domain-containing protein [Burkholderiaceae bacterium]
MAGTDLVLLLLRQSVIVLLVLLVLYALRPASAARRVFAARCGLGALLLMPLAWLLAPPLPLPLHLPYAWTAWLGPPAVLPPMPWLANAPPAAAGFEAPMRAEMFGRAVLMLYGLGLLLHLLRLGWGLWRLRVIAASAQMVVAPAWCDALAALRADMRVTRPVRLLVSDQLTSPLSWGLLQPVIVLDRKSLEAIAPGPVLAHELAHIAAHDWPLMLLARVLLACYWWHPLLHRLLAAIAHDTECAADDAALRAGITPSHYAHTLLQVSRQVAAAGRPVSLAQRLAGRGAALAARVSAALEARRARGPVTRGEWGAGIVLTGVLLAVLGGLAVRGEHVVWPDHLWQTPAGLPGQDAAALLARLDNPNFTQLASAMRGADFSQRHALAVASFRQRAAIPALILALRDERPVVRRLGAWALGEMRFPETAPALAVLLADPVPLVRAEAAGALGDMGEVRWLPVLHALLRDPEPAVRARVAHALGDLADSSSIPVLTAARADPNPAVAQQVQWALHEFD